MQTRRLFPAKPAIQIGMHHVADDRAGSNDGHLHHDVVELLRPQPRKARHLRAALNLKQTDCVGLLKRVINRRIVLRQVSQIDFLIVMIANQYKTFFNRSHHTQAEQINFDDAHIGAVFFVPLNYDASGHSRRFEWHN